MKNETCICCGAVIPEGKQVCPNCERKELTDEEIVKALKVVGKETLAFAYDKEQRRFKYVTAKEILNLIHRLQDENAEFQKQVDELKEERYYTEQDTAKEILGLILAKEFEKGDYLTDDELKKLFEEKYGVEVE
jgi:predicted amidophosphoribosyltransferase